MMRKFTQYLLMSAVWFSVASCVDEEVSAPAKPTFQASQTTAMVGQEITFTVDKVNADAVSLLPYGLPGSDAGILLSDFADGAATVTFSYGRPGTFKAVVVANNHSGDGEDVKNVQSEPITITITTDANSISDFKFIRLEETDAETKVIDVSTDTDIDQDAKTIAVTVPYGTDVTDLIASYGASGFATVKVGGTTQTTEESANNFTNPVVYTVVADDGTTSEYTVTVNVTPVQTTNTIKTISATAVSESSDDKDLPASVDNVNRTIVVYDTYGTTSAQFDSVRIAYELDGSLAILKYGDTVMDQDSLLDLTDTQELVVYSQDSTTAGGIQTYTVYSAAAPKLGVSFPGLNPDPALNVAPTNFNIDINVLKGTDVSAIETTTDVTLPAGVTVASMTANDGAFSNGDDVDYSEPVEFVLTVDDSNLGVTYTVVYTVTVTVI